MCVTSKMTKSQIDVSIFYSPRSLIRWESWGDWSEGAPFPTGLGDADAWFKDVGSTNASCVRYFLLGNISVSRCVGDGT
jgi:hypothetical protein